jgi:hypothetical protein
MTWQTGRADMLALDVPYLYRIQQEAKKHRAAIFAAAVAFTLQDGVITEDEEDALALLALLLLTVRTETSVFGSETVALSREVGMLASAQGFEYASEEARRRLHVLLRYRPIHQPIGSFATAARIGDWPDVAEEAFRIKFGEAWRKLDQTQPMEWRIRQSAFSAIDFLYGTPDDATRGMLTRRAMMTIHQSNLDTFRETAVSAWDTKELTGAQWRWRASLDGRACAACVQRHGQVYPLEHPFRHLHAGCRCMPELIPHNAAPIELGDDWFAKQPKHIQQRILGIGGSVLYREGQARLGDFVRRREDADFGITYHNGGAAYAKKKAERREKRKRKGKQ